MKQLLYGVIITLLGLKGAYSQNTPLWMRYPAISPDGQTIVFSYKGDLYKVSSAGGPAFPLTVHEAYDGMPVWSTDGKYLAFASDRYGNLDVFVMPSQGGEAKRITHYSRNDIPYGFTTDSKEVMFQSYRTGTQDNQLFIDFPELYKASVNGGKANLIIDIPAEMACFDKTGDRIAYHDYKGYEDPHRKHHNSSVTRDIWMYDTKTKKHTQLTNFKGEDRNPVWHNENIFYLSEQTGSFNVFQISASNPAASQQITSFTKHPVRHLTVTNDGTLCFGYHGEIYVKKPGAEPVKVNIQINADSHLTLVRLTAIQGGATEIAVSPNNKEIAYIVRGEVFVSSIEGNYTKRITNTPEQERSVSFSPDGKAVLYASERKGSWNVYQSKIVGPDEPYFYVSTLLKEEALLENETEEFQPSYSPDGKEIAFLEERTTLKVLNLSSKQIRTILAGNKNYSYSDGDQYYEWSPDGKWFSVQFLPFNNWTEDVGLVSSDGKGQIINLTQSGYNDAIPSWMQEGNVLIWFTDRHGMRAHGSWGSQLDVYAMFMNKEAYDKYRLSEDDFKLLKEKLDKEKPKKEEAQKDDKKDKKTKEESEPSKIKTIKIDLEGIQERKDRLTIHSSSLASAVLSNDGEKLYYLAQFEKGYDLWVTNLRTDETKILFKGAADDFGGTLLANKDGKSLFVLSGGEITKVDAESGKTASITIQGEMEYNYLGEKAYIFDHAWRQTLKKFYQPEMHGVDWKMYKAEYEKFLPHIHHNFDFAEMLSELLGELNASHTGCRFRAQNSEGDQTASLGVIYDENFTGPGVKIAEVLMNGPLSNADSKIKEGHIIEKIDGQSIDNNTDFYRFLNKKAGKNVLLELSDGKNNYQQVVKPVSLGIEYNLLYKRWVENRRKMVEKLSGGKVGYVHIEGMNDPSFRTVYEEVLGRHLDKEALIVDTRSNGGGWLHDDLVYFLGGKHYMDFRPRGQNLGRESQFKWTKPSCVIMGEDNYSDAHLFPFAYKALGIGKLIGMPVPGTGTAVWWERQIDNTLVFGIPQVGNTTLEGKYLENLQLEPDVQVKNEPEQLLQGKDQQVEKAVTELLQQIKK